MTIGSKVFAKYKIFMGLAMSVGVAAGGVVLAPAAVASEGEQGAASRQAGFTGWSAAKRTVISKTLLTSTQRGKKLSSMYCHGSSSSGCDVSRSVSLTNTTQTGYGLSGAQVSAQLGLSTSTSTTTTATCHAPKKRGVQGYETGYRYKYKVRSVRTFINAGHVTSVKETKTTGWLYAYRPRGVLCVATA